MTFGLEIVWYVLLFFMEACGLLCESGGLVRGFPKTYGGVEDVWNEKNGNKRIAAHGA
ncbi:hypothetical protein AGMMS49957_02500 [Synergistales bacterium]|nr:hypothetical protein AGMMS49957_02500 [Synergistales bacterium]